MTDPLTLLAQQVQAARQSRSAVRDRAAHTVKRLSPQRLAQDAKTAAGQLAEETGQQIRSHPFTATGAALAVIALIFHKPLGRLTEQLVDQWLPPADAGDNPRSEHESDSPYSADDPQEGSPSPTEHNHDRTLD